MNDTDKTVELKEFSALIEKLKAKNIDVDILDFLCNRYPHVFREHQDWLSLLNVQLNQYLTKNSIDLSVYTNLIFKASALTAKVFYDIEENYKSNISTLYCAKYPKRFEFFCKIKQEYTNGNINDIDNFRDYSVECKVDFLRYHQILKILQDECTEKDIVDSKNNYFQKIKEIPLTTIADVKNFIEPICKLPSEVQKPLFMIVLKKLSKKSDWMKLERLFFGRRSLVKILNRYYKQYEASEVSAAEGPKLKKNSFRVSYYTWCNLERKDVPYRSSAEMSVIFSALTYRWMTFLNKSFLTSSRVYDQPPKVDRSSQESVVTIIKALTLEELIDLLTDK